MIAEVLVLTRRELEDSSGIGCGVDGLDNVTNWNGKLMLSLINVERENVLRNIPPYKKNGAVIEIKEPPVFVNVYMMLVSYSDQYETALKNLNDGMEFFQSKPFLNATNILPGNASLWPPNLEKVLYEWHNLEFDKLSQLWGMHGGRYYPSVLYKVRMMVVEKVEVPQTGPPIVEIQYGANIE